VSPRRSASHLTSIIYVLSWCVKRHIDSQCYIWIVKWRATRSLTPIDKGNVVHPYLTRETKIALFSSSSFLSFIKALIIVVVIGWCYGWWRGVMDIADHDGDVLLWITQAWRRGEKLGRVMLKGEEDEKGEERMKKGFYGGGIACEKKARESEKKKRKLLTWWKLVNLLWNSSFYS